MSNESISIPANFLDGWAKDDLVYVWKDASPVQLANNLSLPGGFQLGAFGSEYCDVVTTTGKYVNLFLLFQPLYIEILNIEFAEPGISSVI